MHLVGHLHIKLYYYISIELVNTPILTPWLLVFHSVSALTGMSPLANINKYIMWVGFEIMVHYICNFNPSTTFGHYIEWPKVVALEHR